MKFVFTRFWMFLLVGALVVWVGAPAVFADGACETIDYPELRSWPRSPQALGLPEFVGSPATPDPLPPISIPPNPFLAEQGRNGLHGDNYNSDTLNFTAPLGNETVVSSRKLGALAATCPTVVFDAHGNVVTICIGVVSGPSRSGWATAASGTTCWIPSPSVPRAPHTWAPRTV